MQTTQKDYPITGREGAPIDLKTAVQWTSNYRQMHPGERISHFFGRVHLLQLLEQEGSMGIRIYYANSLRLNVFQRFLLGISNFLRKGIANAEGEEHLILVGSDREGTDQLPGRDAEGGGTQAMTFRSSATESTFDFKIIEQSNPCPGSPGCPKNELTEG